MAAFGKSHAFDIAWGGEKRLSKPQVGKSAGLAPLRMPAV
jgi:hypothetical protein